jgi:outer membrane putative beta-barrel porin/alpha-amylase
MSLTSRLTVLVLAGSLLLPASAAADDAIVLPKGRSTVVAENLFYLPTRERFNPNGNAEDLTAGFDERRLDSSVFPLLQPLDPFVGGSASIGDSHLRFKYHYNILNVGYAYGITDRLTVGVEIPYYSVRNDVDASVSSGPGSSANVGLRTGPGSGPLCGSGAPVLPLICPNTRRFTTEEVQQLLTTGLPGIPGFGYKRLRDFEDDGLGDIQLGAKYQYWRSQDVRLAASGGVRFPTGRQDDADDLVDMSWSSGAFGLFARLHNDYIVSNLWKETPTAARTGIAAAGDVILNGTFRYEWTLPDEVTLRIAEGDALTTTRERLDRDLGDRFEFEASMQYQLTSSLALAALYRYGFKLKDDFKSDRGLRTQVLEDDTDSTDQQYIVRLSYSTLSLYRAQRFPLPLDISVSYRDRFAGSGPRSGGSPSQVLKTQYIGLRIQVIF